MVRTVHMSIFYKIDLQITDPKIKFLTKTEQKTGFPKIENEFSDPKLTLLKLFRDPNDFQIYPGLFPGHPDPFSIYRNVILYENQ